MSTAAATIIAPRVAAPPKPQVRQQYIDLRTNVHRKLLNKLNLEALAQSDREDSLLPLWNSLASQGVPSTLTVGDLIEAVATMPPQDRR